MPKRKTRTSPGGPTNKGRRFPAEVLPLEEIERLLAACSRRSSSGLRARAMIALAWRTGLRCAELLALRPADLDHQARTLRVLQGKGRKARTVGLDAVAEGYLSAWIERRKALGLNGRHPLFCTLAGRPLSTAYARALIRRLADRAQIERRVHWHQLRHTFAVELMREGKPVNVISGALGHASIATTARYLAHLEPGDVVDAMAARGADQVPAGMREARRRPSFHIDLDDDDTPD